MIVLGPLTPGTNYVRLTAATGTLAANLDLKDVFINSLEVQSDASNDAVGKLEYNGDELASLAKAPATGDLPIVRIENTSVSPNVYNLKLFRIKGDSNDVYHCWAVQA